MLDVSPIIGPPVQPAYFTNISFTFPASFVGG